MIRRIDEHDPPVLEAKSSTRSFASKYDLDVVKKEIKDEVTHILYDQTRRTPIVIPVINEIGGGLKSTRKSFSWCPKFN